LEARACGPGYPWRGSSGDWRARGRQAVALEHAFDGAWVGQWANVEGLEFGQDGGGIDQAVADGRRGVGLEPAANGKDRLLQLRRDALANLACAGQVVQARGAELEIATPPLVKPGGGAVQRLADERDGTARKAERNGTLACREFVVHGNLRGAAAGGRPWRSLYSSTAARQLSITHKTAAQPTAK
jgi:hypothetical protein